MSDTTPDSVPITPETAPTTAGVCVSMSLPPTSLRRLGMSQNEEYFGVTPRGVRKPRRRPALSERSELVFCDPGVVTRIVIDLGIDWGHGADRGRGGGVAAVDQVGRRVGCGRDPGT